MKVYLHGRASEQRSHTLYCCPAGHVEGEVPAEWVDDDRRPKQFTVEFSFGQAEVPSALGRYLVEHGIAHKTKLITGNTGLILP